MHISKPWIDEMTRFIFVWLTYIGGAITVRYGMNISFDLVLDACKGRLWQVAFTSMNLLSMVFLAALAYLGIQNCISNSIQLSTVMKWNMGLVNLAIPVGGVLMLLSQMEYFITQLREHKKEERGC